MESNTELAAKRTRLGPRTQMRATMNIMFKIILSSISSLGSDMVVLDNTLKIRIEPITLPNDNVMEKFYRV